MAEEEKTEEIVPETTEEVTEETTEEAAEEARVEIVYGVGVPMVIEPFMDPFMVVTESVRRRAQLIARNQKLDSGVIASGFIGTILGFLFALFMVLVIPLLIWMVI